jgi:hypothetical protein
MCRLCKHLLADQCLSIAIAALLSRNAAALTVLVCGLLFALQVPVFIFELDRDEPVLIDQHYNARALEDLVMVVQNAANQ